MRKHRSARLLALGSIVAVASGCSGGGNAAVPAKAAPSATKRIASMAHATITPSALVHAMKARRRPSFIDVGAPAGDTLTLNIFTESDVSGPSGVNTSTLVTLAANQTTPITVSFPIYGPTGFIEITEFDSNIPTAIADTGFLEYTIPLGTDVTLDASNVSGTTSGGVFVQGLTLQPLVSAIAVATSPTGAGAVLLSSPDGTPTCLPNLSSGGGTLFLFPVDLLGNFTTATVPGAFRNPVILSANSSPQMPLSSTAVPGAYTYSGTGIDPDIQFQVTDGFGSTTVGALSITTGYMCSLPL